MADLHIPTDPDQIDLPWLQAVVPGAAEATGFTHEPVGTGLMARSYRITLEGVVDLGTVVVKLASADAATRELGASAYVREVGFYRDIAPRLDPSVPDCHHAAVSSDGQAFVVVLQDINPAQQGNQLTGCSPADARRALTTMAHLHAETWGEASLGELPWISDSAGASLGDYMAFALEAFEGRFAGLLAPESWPVLRAFSAQASEWQESQPGTIAAVHGDYRLDNLLFPPTDGPAIAVDWQTVNVVNPGRDLAYFLGNSLTVDDRRAHEHELVDHYRSELAARGVEYPHDRCWSDLRHGTFQGPLVTMLGAFTASRSERSEGMFAVMADRAATQIVDLGALDLL